jgi:hypothetical protein
MPDQAKLDSRTVLSENRALIETCQDSEKGGNGQTIRPLPVGEARASKMDRRSSRGAVVRGSCLIASRLRIDG